MKSIFIRLMSVLATLVLLFVVVGTLLPRDYTVRSEITINAPREMVFENVNDLTNWARWSSWNPERIEGLRITYGDPTFGAGASQTWTDPRGEGKLWFTESDTNKTIQYEMEFTGFPTMQGQIVFQNTASMETTVIWTSEGTLPSGPFYGFFASVFDDGIKLEYDQSLAALKQIIEEQYQDQLDE